MHDQNKSNLENKKICFTGKFSNFSKDKLLQIVGELGATPTKSVTKDTDYLVRGSKGNKQYKYGDFGTKDEKAIHLQREGSHIVIIGENKWLEIIGRLN